MKKSLVLIAMLSAVLASGLTTLAEHLGGDFPDVKKGAYYENAVYEMRQRGIIDGYSNGNFGPNDPVTRGQIVAILDRYDENLLNPTTVSGVSDLITIVCGGFTADDMSNSQAPGAEEAYEKICGGLQ